MSALVIVDRPHSGKPDRVRDLGCWSDLNGDGKADQDEQEAVISAKYALAIECELRELDRLVIPMSDGVYSARHARANSYAGDYTRCVYLTCHVNAGGGSYATTFYDARSATGPDLAKRIASALSFPTLANSHARACSGAKNARAYSCVKGLTRPIGIVLEPFFLDGPHAGIHASTSGLQRIGQSVASAVHQFLLPLGE